MTWEPRPLPEITPETAPFWANATDGEFRLMECGDCGLVFYYPRGHCPDCFNENVTGRPAAGTGEVYTYAATSSIAGWPKDALPVVAAIVELDEGPRVLTNVVGCEPAAVTIGMPVTVDFIETEQEAVAIPVFRPV